MKTHHLFISLLLLISFVVLTPFQVVWAAEKIVMVTPLPNTEVLGKWVELIFTEAFRRMDLELEYKVYPPARASIVANTGEVDGELGRPTGYELTYTNLVRVDEPSMVTYYCAYATDPAIQLKRWEDLKGSDYQVDYLRGASLAEKELPEVVKPENLEPVNEIVQGLKKLTAKRTDVFIAPENMIAPLLATDAAYASILNAGVVQELPMYPYLHKEHADLAPKLAEALKAIKEEGLIEHYKVQAAQELGAAK